MARGKRRFNPIGFTPWPVTVLSLSVYLALLIPLLIVHHVVPSAPKSNPDGVDLEEAWQDLKHLTQNFHPYNSHANDDVHEWLLSRVNQILAKKDGPDPDVFVFNDIQSNLTYSNIRVNSKAATGVYFEGTNIIVYVRGSEDSQEEWWKASNPQPPAGNPGGVLVNAHYDSVSTGFGATDDGVGVVTVLQLIRYFSSAQHRPRKGLVLLLNNGEEDFLNGAFVFSQHPMSRFAHTFLNLEGAGAGGRAVLFRSTDTEVTEFYRAAKHPFGTVLARDAFELGYIRSETDYSVFRKYFGLRGLDLAFMEPRSRYHTDQDDARHTSKDSLWHMLSAAIDTTEGLVSYLGDAFDGDNGSEDTLKNGVGTLGVWFDLFGTSIAVFRLETLIIISILLLILAPLTILATMVILSKKDRMYMFSMYQSLGQPGEKVSLRGLHGLFRFPVVIGLSTALAIGLAFLLTKVNPFIVYSSPYSVWIMMVGAWVFVAWFISCIADFARPSALHRVYSFTWIFISMWILLVIDTVYQKQNNIAGGYFIVFYFAGTFLATWTAYLELFALPPKSEFARNQLRGPNSRDSEVERSLLAPSPDELPPNDRTTAQSSGSTDVEDEAATETTSLLRWQQRTTFANYSRTGVESETSDADNHNSSSCSNHYGHEQKWSAKLPGWTWLIQFLFVAPIVLILIGQLTLFLGSAMYQTGADGGPLLIIYLGVAVFSVLLLLPLSPFLHRFTYHIPIFLLLVCIGTLIYNLAAFPFSSSNRLKVSFIQEVDLASGKNQVSLTGVSPHILDVIKTIPSASEKHITCDSNGYGGRHKCSWDGIEPNIGGGKKQDWLSYNVSRSEATRHATFEIRGKNTRACKILFDSPVRDYSVRGSALDKRFPYVGFGGVSEIRLWSRTWDNTWTVDVEWETDKDTLLGKVVCLWSDANRPEAIPALNEIRKYAPPWVAITKLSDGLVEASRSFNI
ncbi:hypothetical protein FQN57_007161 [Myotisia sp. PD_48]|nr:hypothetical protein FQN57_007161 [Myotisia sp. PD_48]